MKKNNNIIRRARDFDLTESELEDLYSDSNKLDEFYDDTLATNITEELFIPGSNKLLDAKKKEIEKLTKNAIPKQKKSRVLPMKVLGLAASIVLLVGAFFLIKPSSIEISELDIVEFRKISSSTYSPEVIASIERSTTDQTNIELVSAYNQRNYEFILNQTKGQLDNAEISLLRARVLMDLDRYEEGYEIMKTLSEEDLLQKDVYLWMMAEGALGSGDEDQYLKMKENIINNNIPNFEKIIF